MSKVKKIFEGGLEFIKDSAKQAGQTVSPDALVKQALGQQQGNEFSDFLKKQGPDLTPEQMEKKKTEFMEKDKKEKEEAEKVITAAMPAHMRLPQKPPAPRPYEVTIREAEQKEAQQVQIAKKHPQPLVTPASRQARGMPGMRRKSTNKGFEGMQKDTKVG